MGTGEVAAGASSLTSLLKAVGPLLYGSVYRALPPSLAGGTFWLAALFPAAAQLLQALHTSAQDQDQDQDRDKSKRAAD